MADNYARAGYFAMTVDTFNGDPAPYPLTSDPNFGVETWWQGHLPNVTDPIVKASISYVRNSVGVTGVGIAGYCFGGHYSARFLGANRTIRADAAFAVTPSQAASGVDDTPAQIALVNGPITYAFAEVDNRMPRELVNAIVDTLKNSRATDAPYQTVVYGNSNHGFGLRGEILNLQADNSSDPEEVFAKETAFLQALRWFDTYL
ncbi:hypothetical protein diail_4449 [Diaporthe ilicicola]|nr:hypothetical protein diail_4449 [Diaporthe ilicicola]